MPDLFARPSLRDLDTASEPRRHERDLKTHTCLVCGKLASFGFGVKLMHGIEGRWSCFEHRKDVKRMKP